MIPMRTSAIFKSRWMALLWAVGILWGAYEFAGAQPDDDQNSEANQMATATNAL